MKKEDYIFDADSLSHLSELARLDISGEQAELMLSQMREIIEFAAEIRSAEAMLNTQYTLTDEPNRLREDIPEAPLSRQELMSASPKTADGYFSVPDVLKRGGTEE